MIITFDVYEKVYSYKSENILTILEIQELFFKFK